MTDSTDSAPLDDVPPTPIPLSVAPPALPTLPRLTGNFWGWASPGVLLYLASAASALIGVAQMIAPILDNAPLLPRLRPVLVLHGYELLLLGAALLIVLWKRVLDDAVSLVILLTLFLVASATSLDVAAPASFEWVAWFGLAGALMAAGKLTSMARYLVGPWQTSRIVVLAILVAWNFAVPSLMGLRLALTDVRAVIDQALRYWWLLTSWGPAIAAIALIAAQIQASPKAWRGRDAPPFIRSDAMRWIVVALVLACSFVHQFALAWVFGLGFRIADMMLGPALMVPVIIEIRRLMGRRVAACDALLVGMLALTFMVSLASRWFTVGADWHALNHPPMAACLGGLALSAIAIRPGRRVLFAPGGAFFVLGVVTFNWPAQPMLAWLPHGLGAMTLAVILLGLGTAASLSKPAARQTA